MALKLCTKKLQTVLNGTKIGILEKDGVENLKFVIRVDFDSGLPNMYSISTKST